MSAPCPAAGVIGGGHPVGRCIDRHPAPRHRFVVTLSGEAEVATSAGESRGIGPGTVMRAEDVTGKGHITRDAGVTERPSPYFAVPDRAAPTARSAGRSA